MKPRKRDAKAVQADASRKSGNSRTTEVLWRRWDRCNLDPDRWVSGLELLTDGATEMVQAGGSAATAAKLYRLADALAGLGHGDFG
jgi:hypothetical protein